MRPGRFHPGNSRKKRRPRFPAECFNEAGAFPPRKCFLVDTEELLLGQASMRPGRFHPGNKDVAIHSQGLRVASMRPGRFHPGNGAWFGRPARPRVASMRPGRFHPGNSPSGTPCAAWVFHPFCERWPLCLLEHANCSPNAYHNTTYLLVIQIESTMRELPAFFLPPEHSQGTRQIPR